VEHPGLTYHPTSERIGIWKATLEAWGGGGGRGGGKGGGGVRGRGGGGGGGGRRGLKGHRGTTANSQRGNGNKACTAVEQGSIKRGIRPAYKNGEMARLGWSAEEIKGAWIQGRVRASNTQGHSHRSISTQGSRDRFNPRKEGSADPRPGARKSRGRLVKKTTPGGARNLKGEPDSKSRGLHSSGTRQKERSKKKV